ncbi:MAG: 1-acyl-sn-glycerol-3-phosphate acyltransferase [Planctomycetota bacterium]
MTHLLRILFHTLIVRPLLLVVLGLNVRHRERLPLKGPAILAANHNSHLDTVALLSLIPLGRLAKVRPVAAADYFLSNRFLKWFSTRLMGIIPLQRTAAGESLDDRLEGAYKALERGEMLVLFPEGSRGEAEELSRFKSGVAHIAMRFPEVPVHPIFMHGLGKVLPKGEGLLVPFFCDVFVGEAMPRAEERTAYMRCFEERMQALADEGDFPAWD